MAVNTRQLVIVQKGRQLKKKKRQLARSRELSRYFTPYSEMGRILTNGKKKINVLPGRESNPGLPRDRRRYLPLYYRGLTGRTNLKTVPSRVKPQTGMYFLQTFSNKAYAYARFKNNAQAIVRGSYKGFFTVPETNIIHYGGGGGGGDAVSQIHKSTHTVHELVHTV